MRRVGIVVVLAMTLAGCMRGHSDRAYREQLPTTTAWNGIGTMLNADYICKTYAPGPVVDAITTTVQAFRDLRMGPNGPRPKAFPKYSGYAAAAWCWTGHKGAYSVYEVVPDGTAVKIASGMSRPFHDDQGAPVIP
jgi:hypothetical protein